MMTPEKRERVRMAVLLGAELAKPYGVGLAAMGVATRLHGFGKLDADVLLAEVDYLADKGFLEETAKAISPENKLWRISAAGRDFLAQEGLA